jgi:hypothetical protein
LHIIEKRLVDVDGRDLAAGLPREHECLRSGSTSDVQHPRALRQPVKPLEDTAGGRIVTGTFARQSRVKFKEHRAPKTSRSVR